jgi:hypothetical protein
MLVEDEGHYLEVSRYIHLNPVRAGIVKRPEDYVWSSYPGYHHGRKTLPWLNYSTVLAEFGDTKMAFRRYRQFVHDGISKKIRPPWQDAIGGWLLGSRKFAAKIYGMLSSDCTDNRWDSRAALDDYPLNATLDEIADAVCKVYNIDKALLLSRGNNTRKARSAFIFVARDRAGASLKSVASYLRLRTLGTISRVMEKSRVKIARSKDFRRRIIKAESHLHKKANKGV